MSSDDIVDIAFDRGTDRSDRPDRKRPRVSEEDVVETVIETDTSTPMSALGQTEVIETTVETTTHTHMVTEEFEVPAGEEGEAPDEYEEEELIRTTAHVAWESAIATVETPGEEVDEFVRTEEVEDLDESDEYEEQ